MVKICIWKMSQRGSPCRDLCSVFNAQILPFVETEAIVSLLQTGRRSKANKTKTLATWATKEIRRIKNSVNNGFTGAMPGAIPT